MTTFPDDMTVPTALDRPVGGDNVPVLKNRQAGGHQTRIEVDWW